ncbi:Hypothetical predicted protein [Cloeon dipterum]|uniref:Sushi domain-containing protein n=1 Tax=Cloeon dipterum TaxID=197152 RepID=A0A8S1DQH7_9INSE|nr:Hypothetical predicted protein [Cloeon dipterum]
MAISRLFVIISVAVLIVNAVGASNTATSKPGAAGKPPSVKEECNASAKFCLMPLEVLNLTFFLNSTTLKPCEGGFESDSKAEYVCRFDKSITFNSNCTDGKWNPNVLEPTATITLPPCNAGSDFVAGSIWLVLSAILFINM